MEYKIYLLYAVLVIFFGYLAVIAKKYGWLDSISDSFYHLPKKYNWIFTVFLWTISIMLIMIGGTNLMYLAGVCIMFVGTWPWFNDGERIQHFIAAGLGIGLGMLSLWCDFGLWYIPVSFGVIVGILKLLKVNHFTYWLEVVAFSEIIGGLFIAVKNMLNP